MYKGRRHRYETNKFHSAISDRHTLSWSSALVILYQRFFKLLSHQVYTVASLTHPAITWSSKQCHRSSNTSQIWYHLYVVKRPFLLVPLSRPYDHSYYTLRACARSASRSDTDDSCSQVEVGWDPGCDRERRHGAEVKPWSRSCCPVLSFASYPQFGTEQKGRVEYANEDNCP